MKAKINNLIMKYQNRYDALKVKRTMKTVSISEAQEMQLIDEFLGSLRQITVDKTDKGS